jgi:hypothetical protein
MPPVLPRLRDSLRKAPPQMLLVGLVAACALASALFTGFTGRGSGVPARSGTSEAGPPAAASFPEDEGAPLCEPVQEAFEAARKGDLDRYLAQFTDPLRGRLSGTRTEKGDAYLRDYLARLTAPLKGLAVDLARRAETAPDTIRLPVEFIYVDRNEVQRFTLRREGGRWRISEIEDVRAAPTLIPYGTPIESVKR